MLKKDYELLEYGDYVRPNGGPLRGLVLQVVHAEDNDIFTQQENNPAFIYVRNYRAFDLLYHFTDLEKKIQELHDTVWDRNPYPDRGKYPTVEGTVNRSYWIEKTNIQFANHNEERITRGLYLLLSENGIKTLEDLVKADPDDISKIDGMDSASYLYTCRLREAELYNRNRRAYT